MKLQSCERDKKLSTREWLLVIIILMGLQFILHSISYLYSGSANALGYVSFAGTIVSILLGLIAIIYSFVQTVSQSSSVVEIKRQVDTLVKATGDIVESKNLIHASAVEVGAVSSKLAEKIQENSENYSSVNDNLSRLLATGKDAEKKADTVYGSAFDSTRTWVRIACLSIGEGVKRGWSMSDIASKIVGPLCKKTDTNSDYVLGSIATVVLVLESEGLVKFQDHTSAIVGISNFDEKYNALVAKLDTAKSKNVLAFKDILAGLDDADGKDEDDE